MILTVRELSIGIKEVILEVNYFMIGLVVVDSSMSLHDKMG